MIREIGTLASGGVIGYAVCLLACWRKVQDANATLDRIANAGLDQIEEIERHFDVLKGEIARLEGERERAFQEGRASAFRDMAQLRRKRGQ